MDQRRLIVTGRDGGTVDLTDAIGSPAAATLADLLVGNPDPTTVPTQRRLPGTPTPDDGTVAVPITSIPSSHGITETVARTSGVDAAKVEELLNRIEQLPGGPMTLLFTPSGTPTWPARAPLPSGVYRHNDPAKVGPGTRGMYLLLVEARNHATGEECVVYAPLYDKAEWGDTLRASIRTRNDFDANFTHVGRGAPADRNSPPR